MYVCSVVKQRKQKGARVRTKSSSSLFFLRLIVMKVDSFAIENDACNKNCWSDAKGPWQLNYMLKMNYIELYCFLLFCFLLKKVFVM